MYSKRVAYCEYGCIQDVWRIVSADWHKLVRNSTKCLILRHNYFDYVFFVCARMLVCLLK